MKADYGWIILVVFVILLAVFWTKITGGIEAYKNKDFDQAAYDAGEKLFNDVNAWTPLEDKSCAMCHSPEFKNTGGYKITMRDFNEGSPLVLKDLQKKYKNDMLTNKDALYEQVMECMTNQDRMSLHRASQKSVDIQNLLAYLKAL